MASTPLPRPAAVRLFALDRNEHVDPPLVAQLDLRRSIDDAPIGFDAAVIEHIGQRIMPAGFTGRADDEVKIASAAATLPAPMNLHGRQHRRQAPLLFACAAPPDAFAIELVGRAV